MTLAMNFLTIMAWVGLVLGGLLRLLGAWYHSTDKLQQLQDQLRGVRRHFPVAVPFWITVVCAVFLIAKAMS